jgi:hypothetical protein
MESMRFRSAEDPLRLLRGETDTVTEDVHGNRQALFCNPWENFGANKVNVLIAPPFKFRR